VATIVLVHGMAQAVLNEQPRGISLLALADGLRAWGHADITMRMAYYAT
jgi:hypothetical protein